MSGTGESTGDFDDDQHGNVAEPAPDASAGYVFAEIAGATAMPDEVPDGIDRADGAAGDGAAADDVSDSDATDGR